MQNHIDMLDMIAKQGLISCRELTRQDSEMAREGCNVEAPGAAAPSGPRKGSGGAHFSVRVVEVWNVDD